MTLLNQNIQEHAWKTKSGSAILSNAKPPFEVHHRIIYDRCSGKKHDIPEITQCLPQNYSPLCGKDNYSLQLIDLSTLIIGFRFQPASFIWLCKHKSPTFRTQFDKTKVKLSANFCIIFRAIFKNFFHCHTDRGEAKR